MTWTGKTLVDIRAELLNQVRTKAGSALVDLLGARQSRQDVEVFAIAQVRDLDLTRVRRIDPGRAEGVLSVEVRKDVDANYHDDWEILSELGLALEKLQFTITNKATGDGLTTIAVCTLNEPTISELGEADGRFITSLEVDFVVEETS